MTRATVLAALCGACVAGAVVEWLSVYLAGRRHRRARGSASPAAGAARTGPAPPRGTAGSLVRALVAAGGRLGLRGDPDRLAARVAAAGAPLGLRAADVAALRSVFALAAVPLAVALASALPGRLGLVALVAAPAGAFLAPELLLARRARSRARLLAGEAADALDLLRVAVAAGLPSGRALGEVGRRRGGLLGRELRRVADELALGVPRAEALQALAVRCPLPEIAALAAAIGRSDRHGAPLAPALEALAADARAEQARRVRDEAARAAPKIQLVVALVLVPAVMLLVAAALAQSLLDGA